MKMNKAKRNITADRYVRFLTNLTQQIERQNSAWEKQNFKKKKLLRIKKNFYQSMLF